MTQRETKRATRVAVACLGAAALLAGVLVAVRWTALEGVAKAGVESVQRLQALRARVQRQVHTADVWVIERGSTLSLKVVNSPLLRQKGDDLRAAAADLAAEVHHALPPEQRYSRYEIVIVQRSGRWLPPLKGHYFQFEADSL